MTLGMPIYETQYRSGEDPMLGQGVYASGCQYQAIPDGTEVTLGAVGAPGDYIEAIIITAGTTPTLTLKDGTTTIIDAMSVTVGQRIELRLRSVNGGWKVDLGGTTPKALASGVFS